MNEKEKITPEEVAKMFGIPPQMIEIIKSEGIEIGAIKTEMQCLAFIKDAVYAAIKKAKDALK